MSTSKGEEGATKKTKKNRGRGSLFALIKKKSSKKKRYSLPAELESEGSGSPAAEAPDPECASLTGVIDFSDPPRADTAVGIGDLEAHLLEVSAQLEVAQGDLDIAQKELEVSHRELEVKHRELEESQRELEVSHTELEVARTELEVAHRELDATAGKLKQAGGKIRGQELTIASLQSELQKSQKELEESQDELANMAQITENLDDDSFHEAQEFQLKKKIGELQEELTKRKNLERQVNTLKEEIQDLQTQNQELRFQEERSSTRSKMKSLSEEKTLKEEVQRLQKELRASERKLKIESSNIDAQMKVAQDSNERLQEKVKIAQRRADEIEKEKMDLRIENNRLMKKLESSGSFAEKKRFQNEQETAQLELKNLKRKTERLEQKLITASQQMLNTAGLESSEGSGESGGASFAPRQTLSEARIGHLEKELAQLEATVSKLKKENSTLADKASGCEQTSEVFALKVKQLDQQLSKETTKAEEMETELNRLRQLAAGDSGEDYLTKVLKQIEDLEKGAKEQETRFHVKEKDLWSTIEAQKKQIQELEMEKLALELGEEEEGEQSDSDDRRSETPKMSSEVISLREEVEKLKSENQTLGQPGHPQSAFRLPDSGTHPDQNE